MSAARLWMNFRWPNPPSLSICDLKDAGLVRSSQDGPRVGYCINFDGLRRLIVDNRIKEKSHDES